ncbi:MAG: LptE family protein [Chitinophagales bacterium]|nr:LptE family protein [Chitinophagales bacterium]
MKSPLLLLIILMICFPSCKFYSFTGASIPPEVKTIQVDYFQNNAGGGPASLSQTFTETLKDKFLSDADLKLVTRDADITMKGFISLYTIEAKAPVEGETTALNRLNISVNIEYINKPFPEDNWTKTFRAFSEFESGIDVISIQDELIDEITEQLADDIFVAALVKW